MSLSGVSCGTGDEGFQRLAPPQECGFAQGSGGSSWEVTPCSIFPPRTRGARRYRLSAPVWTPPPEGAGGRHPPLLGTHKLQQILNKMSDNLHICYSPSRPSVFFFFNSYKE